MRGIRRVERVRKIKKKKEILLNKLTEGKTERQTEIEMEEEDVKIRQLTGKRQRREER